MWFSFFKGASPIWVKLTVCRISLIFYQNLVSVYRTSQMYSLSYLVLVKKHFKYLSLKVIKYKFIL